MSALVRYFIHCGVVVGGYDKTPSTLTRQLEKEGALIHYEENVDDIPHACRRADSCLVVYTWVLWHISLDPVPWLWL